MLDVVIVNWNAGRQLLECVKSVRTYGAGTVLRIVIVDNGSVDGSGDAVDGLSGAEVIRLRRNLGFAAACNRGAAVGDAPYLLFLNPDARLLPNSLSVPLAFLNRSENSDVGICGVQLVDEEGRVSRTCARFPTLGRLAVSALGLDKLPGLHGAGVHMMDWNHAETRVVDHVMGAFFLIRRQLFEELGGFDEQFFVYLEDVDLSLRARRSGWDSVYLAEARAFHAGGGTSRQVKAYRLFYSLRSRLLYGFKHFPRWQAWCLVALTGMVEPFTRTFWCLLNGDVGGIRHTWSAYRMLWRGMRRIVRGDGRFEP